MAVSWFRRLPCGHPQELHLLSGAAAALVPILLVCSRWQHAGSSQFVCKPRCSTFIRIITTFHSDAFISKKDDGSISARQKFEEQTLSHTLDTSQTKFHPEHCKRNPSDSKICQARGNYLLLTSVRSKVGAQ